MIGNNDDVKYMVGKVTIYPKMKVEARYAITFFLKYFFEDKDKLFVPIREEAIPEEYLIKFEQMFDQNISVNENFRILTNYLKEYSERIPALIKAYIELASTMKSFGTCFDPDFGNIYDTGIMIAIDDIYNSKKERYMSYYIKKRSIIDTILNKEKII